MSISKEPPVGTPLSVICKTPSGSTLVGVTIEVIGLRRDVTTEKDIPGQTNRTPVTIRGQNDYVISDQEIDDTRNSPSESGLGLAPDECILNITASGADFQPDRPGRKPGDPEFTQIHLVKGKKTFAPATPIVLTLIHKCLASFPKDKAMQDKVAAILKKRVRNLTVDEAYIELIHRHKAGTIRLIPEPKFDPDCDPSTPFVSIGRVKTVKGADGKDTNVPDTGPDGKQKFVSTKMVEIEPQVGAVKLLYNAQPSRSSKGVSAAIRNVNPINAVGLVRLVMILTRRFAITEFHHVGVGRGVIVNNADCHDWGRAIDFAGVRIPDPAGKATTLLLTLQEDWATETVPKIAEIGQRPSKAARDAAWPQVSTNNLELRFLSLNLAFDASDPADEQDRVVKRALADKRVSQSLKDAFNKALKDPKDPKKKPTAAELEPVRTPLLAERRLYVNKAQEFFQTFYDWAADNYTDKSTTPDAPTPANPPAAEIPVPDALETPEVIPALPPRPPLPVGLGGFIMHADHRSTNTADTPPPPHFDINAKNGREAHSGHYHIQIGPTHGKMPDEPALL